MRKILFILLISIINIILGQDDPMNYIIDNIYLGDSNAGGDEEYLKSYNITAVVNCAVDCISYFQDIKYIELNLIDEDQQSLFPKLEVAYKFIKLNSQNNVLVHCILGKSRSTSLVIYYLMKEKKWDYDTCLKYVQERRPCADPSFHFVRQLKEYYNKYIK